MPSAGKGRRESWKEERLSFSLFDHEIMEIPDVKVTDSFFVRKGLKENNFQILLDNRSEGLFPHALFRR